MINVLIKWSGLKTFWGHAIVLLMLSLVPSFLSEYYLRIVIEGLILAVFAMSLDLIMGYAGIVSFGHAAFFGLGGYAMGIILLYVSESVWLGLLTGGCIAGCLAFCVGVVSIRTRGIYFAILTLLFAEIVYRVVFHLRILGGSDGLIGLPMPELNFIITNIDITSTRHFYYFTLIFMYLSYLVCFRIVNSPFGMVLRALNDNENRVPYLGFHVKSYKIIAFVASGFLAGLSGALFSLFKSFADTQQLHFLLSGKVIIMDLLGGLGTLLGPMIGAIFLLLFESIVSSFIESYHILTGILLIIIVIFLPEGLLGILNRLKERSSRWFSN